MGYIARAGDKDIAFRRRGREDDIVHMIKVSADGEQLLIAPGQLDVIIIAGIQIGVARIIGIFIVIGEEGVQLLIAGAIDPSAIAQHQCIFTGAVQLIIEKGGREKVRIGPGKRGVLYDGIAHLMTFGPGVLYPRPYLRG